MSEETETDIETEQEIELETGPLTLETLSERVWERLNETFNPLRSYNLRTNSPLTQFICTWVLAAYAYEDELVRLEALEEGDEPLIGVIQSRRVLLGEMDRGAQGGPVVTLLHLLTRTGNYSGFLALYSLLTLTEESIRRANFEFAGTPVPVQGLQSVLSAAVSERFSADRSRFTVESLHEDVRGEEITAETLGNLAFLMDALDSPLLHALGFTTRPLRVTSLLRVRGQQVPETFADEDLEPGQGWSDRLETMPPLGPQGRYLPPWGTTPEEAETFQTTMRDFDQAVLDAWEDSP